VYEVNFANANDFVSCVNSGCEVEFLYGNKAYSVAVPEGKIIVCEQYNEESEVIYTNPIEALSYPIGNKTLGDVLTTMTVTFRSF